MRRRIKRTTKQYIIVAFICITVMGGAAAVTAFMITGQIKDKYSALLNDAQQELADKQKTVFVAIKDIIRGDYITADNVVEQTVYSGQPPETFISSEDIGKVSIIDITPGTQILKGMLSENTISSELRELEYNVININSNITNNDTVDIRICYPNGEDFAVLSKKVIKSYPGDLPKCLLWLKEEEIIRMHSAIVDAFLYTGAYLYTTKYIEPNIQESTIVTYIPSVEAINLIKENPNILDTATDKLSILVRKALENRLAVSLSKDVKQQWDISSNFIYPDKDTSITTPSDLSTVIQGTSQTTDTNENTSDSLIDSEEKTNSIGADLGMNQMEQNEMEQNQMEQLEQNPMDQNQSELGAQYFRVGG